MKFLFMDDSGNRGKRDKWFCLGGVIVDADDVPKLKDIVVQHRADNQLPDECELKYSDVGRSKSTKKKPNVLVDAGYKSFRDRAALEMELVERCLTIPSIQIVGTAALKKNRPKSFAEYTLDLMVERYTFELQGANDHGVIVCDHENSKHEEFRATVRGGSWFVGKHDRIAETIMFVPSHFSPGVQVADSIAGGVGRWWNHDDPKYVYKMIPRLRRYNERWKGAGLKSVPDHYPPDDPAPPPSSDTPEVAF